MPSKKNRIPESKLIKALAELENVAKGDDLEDADPEGGLSTEGKPLSDEAPKGRGESTKKSRSNASSPFGSASSSSAGSSDDDDDDDGDDDGSSDGSSPPPAPPKKDKKKDKGKKVSKARSTSTVSGDDDDDDAEKSFRDMADDDETMRKGILVNEFLESMVDQLSIALLHVKEGVIKSIQETGASIIASIDERVAKSDAGRRDFDVRMARATAAIGTAIQGELLPMVDMVKSLADQPATSPRGKAVLSKGEVNQPPWSGPGSVSADQRLASGSEGDYVEELRGLGTNAISDWLFKKSATNQLDQNVLVAFEADRYDPAMLPPAVRKAIVNDLVK